MAKHWYHGAPPPQAVTPDPYAIVLNTLINGMLKSEKKRQKKEEGKKPDEKKDDKKPKTFTYLQTAAICIAFGIPAGALDIFILDAFKQAFLRVLHLQ